MLSIVIPALNEEKYLPVIVAGPIFFWKAGAAAKKLLRRRG